MAALYIKTEAGQQAFKARSAQLAGRLRSAFLLFDGQRWPLHSLHPKCSPVHARRRSAIGMPIRWRWS